MKILKNEEENDTGSGCIYSNTVNYLHLNFSVDCSTQSDVWQLSRVSYFRFLDVFLASKGSY